MRRHLRPLIVVLLLLAGCGDDEGSSDPIALESGDGPTGGAADDADLPADDDADEADPPGSTAPDGAVVDASDARPGTWQVGVAGTVTFSIEDGRLVLDDVAPADDWDVTEQETDGDELGVDLQRGDETYEFQVELEDGGTHLTVAIDHDLDGVGPGTFEFGDAGDVTVTVDGDRLVLDDLTVADGWRIATREEEPDEIELDLVRGDQRWELEIELDDGRLDVQRDYEVSGRR